MNDDLHPTHLHVVRRVRARRAAPLGPDRVAGTRRRGSAHRGARRPPWWQHPLVPALVPVMTALPALPPAVSVVPAPSRSTVTPTALRAEGILEIGRVPGTSVLFVQTRVKLHLLHSTWLPDRQLDDYAVSLAVTWIEGHGLPSCTVANNLGVSETTLRNALTKAGYERLSPAQHAALAVARSARKLGNRRGRLVRSTRPQARAREPTSHEQGRQNKPACCHRRVSHPRRPSPRGQDPVSCSSTR